jgi:hypothetical protein
MLCSQAAGYVFAYVIWSHLVANEVGIGRRDVNDVYDGI